MKAKTETQDLQDILKQVAEASYEKYQSYSHYAGVLESLLISSQTQSTKTIKEDLLYILNNFLK